jgi:hypothetical protein
MNSPIAPESPLHQTAGPVKLTLTEVFKTSRWGLIPPGSTSDICRTIIYYDYDEVNTFLAHAEGFFSPAFLALSPIARNWSGVNRM